MNEILQLILSNGFSIAAIVSILGLVLNFLLKRYVTDENIESWGIWVKGFFRGVGIACTLGLSKIPYVKNVWNNVLEAYVIIILRMAILNMLEGFITGLETDQPSNKKD